MTRSTRRARRTRESRREGNATQAGEKHVLPLAASLSTALASLFVLCALLVMFAWPAAPAARDKGFLAAARAQAKESVAQLRTLTLPEFVARVAERLRNEGVPVTVEGAGTILVLDDAAAPEAHFARSEPMPLPQSRSRLETFARALSWGLNCYVEPVDARGAGRCGDAPTVACEQGYAPLRFAGVEFEGHADALPFRPNPRGEDNESLAAARGSAAKDVVEGCLPDGVVVLTSRGTGARAPRVDPASDGRNRRVEIRFLP